MCGLFVFQNRIEIRAMVGEIWVKRSMSIWVVNRYHPYPSKKTNDFGDWNQGVIKVQVSIIFPRLSVNTKKIGRCIDPVFSHPLWKTARCTERVCCLWGKDTPLESGLCGLHTHVFSTNKSRILFFMIFHDFLLQIDVFWHQSIHQSMSDTSINVCSINLCIDWCQPSIYASINVYRLHWASTEL